jgi:hydrocephalus-inducing protein
VDAIDFEKLSTAPLKNPFEEERQK